MAHLSRRAFMNLGLQVPAAGAALYALAACAQKEKPTAAAEVCADPAKLTPAEASQREGFHYVEHSPDPAKTCAGCGFFTPADSGSGCGKCQVFLGPANPLGHCDSWAARPA